jgi:hypothetical protein
MSCTDLPERVIATYRRGAELPVLVLPWETETSPGVWEDLDLTSGYTFALTLVASNGTTTTPSGVTGALGKATVNWANGALDLAPGCYEFRLRATTGGLDRDYRPGERVLLVITA